MPTHLDRTHSSKPFPTLWILIMGVMIAIGPLAIDMYLPALPSMADEFGVSTTNIARSVPAYFIGLVFGQLFYGPFSDRVGRVKPMYIGMIIFVIASIICATTNTEAILFMARTLQAVGACVTGVVTRAAIRDTLNPIQSAKAFSLMVLVMGVAPILAPTLGAAILRVADWHTIFWFLAAYGTFVIILTKLFLKETLTPENRNTQPISQTITGYIDLLKDKTFTVPAVAAGVLQGSFFIYLSISSVLFMENYGLSEENFAIAFGANAFGFIALTQVNQFLIKRFRLVQLLRFGASVQLASASFLLLLGLVFGGDAHVALVFIAIFCCIAGLGLTQPNAGAIALAFQKKRAGMAAAMQGALQFSVGIFGGLVLSLFDTNPVVKLGITATILTAVGTWLVYRIDARLDLSKVD
ncbi:multidrug effflux MFS transporter [Moraxella haemolytica]|uniref:multidrug effflux MFS transporter n=1 Tax=Moraxella haemolytica TaxID=2904119 RepID=UPI002542CD5B|nr:multidrug effflux MFS transporter [Moraxella sp. ZY171148]WII95073.1 multidrug effflux MFS transporter [Moraxella sp. ZY171148]